MFRLLFNCQFCCGGFVLRSEGDIVDTSRQTLSVEEYLARRTVGVPYLFAQGIEYRHAIGLDGVVGFDGDLSMCGIGVESECAQTGGGGFNSLIQETHGECAGVPILADVVYLERSFGSPVGQKWMGVGRGTEICPAKHIVEKSARMPIQSVDSAV